MSAYLAFSQILDYPTGPMNGLFDECNAELASEFPDADELLLKFRDVTAGTSLGVLEELYTNTFDLRPDCTMNLGYHLFGDDSRRGVFLAELKERMERSGIAIGVELPDHLSLVLRYVDAAEEERSVLVQDCLLPALSRMTGVLESGGNPYQFVLRSLMLWLRLKHGTDTQLADLMEP